MSSQGNGQPTSYTVSMSAKTKAEATRLHRQEMQAGTGHQFLTAFREILGRLNKDPMILGEPLYHLPALDLTVRKVAISPLVVDYAVHEQKKLVFIRGIKVLSY